MCPDGTREVLLTGNEQWCARPDDTRHGPYRLWSTGGVVLAEGAYHEGRRTGTWTERHPEGGIKSEGAYGGIGLRSGAWAWFYADGLPQAEGSFDGGKEHGPWTWWYPNGNRERAGSYVLGNEDGPWTTWHPNGQVASQGTWRNGDRLDDWRWFDATGTPLPGPP